MRMINPSALRKRGEKRAAATNGKILLRSKFFFAQNFSLICLDNPINECQEYTSLCNLFHHSFIHTHKIRLEFFTLFVYIHCWILLFYLHFLLPWAELVLLRRRDEDELMLPVATLRFNFWPLLSADAGDREFHCSYHMQLLISIISRHYKNHCFSELPWISVARRSVVEFGHFTTLIIITYRGNIFSLLEKGSCCARPECANALRNIESKHWNHKFCCYVEKCLVETFQLYSVRRSWTCDSHRLLLFYPVNSIMT